MYELFGLLLCVVCIYNEKKNVVCTIQLIIAVDLYTNLK